ncbi:MAG: phosphoribosylaminoimidazolesuccinocarboxamide synthase [Gemmatimonadaceae bacterium]
MMALSGTRLPLRLLRKGKVRDVYEIDDEIVLLVATDRVSAFDVVMVEPIPHKGRVLTQLTAWWLNILEPHVRHHLLSTDVADMVAIEPELGEHVDVLEGRSMLCHRASVFPVECVIRGYITGSAWREYSVSGTLAGEKLTPGLLESERLADPVFSPATKAEEGHDENIPISRMEQIVGSRAAAELERLTRRIYQVGSDVALASGIIIADTKLEYGLRRGAEVKPEAQRTPHDLAERVARDDDEFDASRVILVDEVLTPDSSRFWPADRFEPGHPQASFDKQPLRDYLENERREGRWNGEHPAPPLPGEVVEATSERYLEIFRRLTHLPLDTGATH